MPLYFKDTLVYCSLSLFCVLKGIPEEDVKCRSFNLHIINDTHKTVSSRALVCPFMKHIIALKASSFPKKSDSKPNWVKATTIKLLKILAQTQKSCLLFIPYQILLLLLGWDLFIPLCFRLSFLLFIHRVIVDSVWYSSWQGIGNVVLPLKLNMSF